MKSPCIKVCVMDVDRGYCKGCQRTLDEIARWATMSDDERERVMAGLEARKQGRTADWYFDFVSPFSYLCFHRLKELPGVAIRFRPVLFAGLLNHWGQKGPAEIPAKRLWTYRWCTWWAKQLGIPFRFPAVHPFNPLHHLRLCIAAGNTQEAVARIFADLWTTGADPADQARFARLCDELGVNEAQLSAAKDLLRKNTDEAAAQGVFGVPSFVIDGEVFWGADAIEFVRAFGDDPALFAQDEMRRIAALPVGAARKS